MARHLLLLVALACAASAAAPAAAQSRPKRIQFDEAFDIVGKVQKPEVTVVISRENLNKGYNLALRESFLPKVVEAIDRKPF